MAAHRADTGSYRLGNDAESRNDAETEAFLSPATTRGYSPDHMTSGQSNHDSDRSAALIDFTASPPPLHPAVPTTGGSTVPRPAFHHLLDDSFALESPPRLPLSAPEPAETAPPPVASPPEEDSPPVARPARKRWSVMTRLRDEARVQEARTSLSPIRGFSPTQSGAAGDHSVFFSPTQMAAVDMSLIADEAGSFMIADSSRETNDSPQPVRITIDSTAAGSEAELVLGQDSSGALHVPEEGESGGMSVLLQKFERAEDTAAGTRDPLLSQSSILPAALTSSHRRALQQSTLALHRDRQPAPDASLLDASFAFGEENEPSRVDTSGAAELSLLNCSTTSFKDYRDSPRKPRLMLETHDEDWSLEIDEGAAAAPAAVEREGGASKTPRPRRLIGRVSDASSEGSSGHSFRLDAFQTSTFGTGILNQSPPTAALKPESTGTLRLEYGLDSVPFPPSAAQHRSVSPPGSPETELASSTRTITGAAPSARSNRSSTTSTIVERDLLGVGALASPSRSSSQTSLRSSQGVEAPIKKTMTGAERLKKRLEELRAQKKANDQAGVPPASTANEGGLRTSIGARTPAKRASLGPAASATAVSSARTARFSRPRQSAVPAPTSSSSSTALRPSTPAGERKESTAARLERLRTERKEREFVRTTTTTPGRTPRAGITRSASFVAPPASAALSSRRSLAGSGARGLPTSRSLADLGAVDRVEPAQRVGTGLRRGSLLPSSASSSDLARYGASGSDSMAAVTRRTSLAPMASRPRASLAPLSAMGPSAHATKPPSAETASTIAPTVARASSIRRSSSLRQMPPPQAPAPATATAASHGGSLPAGSSSTSIRRSSSLRQLPAAPAPSAGGGLASRASRRSSVLPVPKAVSASMAPPPAREPLRSTQPPTVAPLQHREDATGGKLSAAKTDGTRRMSRLARPSLSNLSSRY
ncbi:hypothetical protein JCM8202v2_001115 [Rhodotorula sphaerocarpa]